MRVEEDFDLTEYNSYRVASRCSRAWFPDTEQDLQELYSRRKDYVLIGNGYNIILADEYYSQEFVIFNGNFKKASSSADGEIVAQAGCSMDSLSELALAYSLTGLEIFYDIPSSLGGAVVMNAGASGEEIKDVLVKVRYLDLNEVTMKEIEHSDILFSYRDSLFQRSRDKVILQAWLKLQHGDKELIRAKMNTVKAKRWAKQPRDFPNAGSVFKRPKGYYVGSIVEELGLKGHSIGGAMVSEKHGGFIINHANATGRDILDLILYLQDRIRDSLDLELEIEQRIITNR